MQSRKKQKKTAGFLWQSGCVVAKGSINERYEYF